jgi:Xaa-Pro aminopeptidase
LQDLSFDIRPYKDFFPFLSTLENTDVWLDDRTSKAVVDALPLPPARIGRSPIQQMKEIKNDIELNGFRECHYRDCAAVCQTLEWLQGSIDNNVTVTELDVIKYLEHRQQEKDYFIGIAFDTISATGSNTALVEYAPSTEDGGKKILRDLYYLDGGANYLDGTTDMTRTLHFGEPTKKQIECYTLLLRGILAVEMTAFRSDYVITGYRIDALLQQYFNAQHYSSSHVSFGHGVSHGQGVIEGGVTISDVHSVANRVPIKPNMVVTLEPGIYFEGQWGCRIENVYVIEQDQSGWMYFVPLTLIPYSHKMIDFNLLTKQELMWIDKYHQRCLDKVNGGQWMTNEINKFRQ